MTPLWSRRSVIVFFLIGFGVPWLGWTIIALTEPRPPLRTVLFYTGDFMTIAGLVATAVAGGAGALRALLRRSVRGGPVGWWLFALFLPLAYTVASRVVYGASHEGIGRIDLAGLATYLAPGVLLAFTTGPLGEEAGWRGFLQPRLLTRYSPLQTCLILGVIWGLWHYPLYVKTLFASGPAAIRFVTGTVCYSILMTVLFYRTRGSVLLAVLFHWTVNISPRVADALLPDARSGASQFVGYWYDWAALLVTTAIVGSVVGWRTLGRNPGFEVERDLADESVARDQSRAGR
jgi:membrane protease YdiL (CAAX protease family)